MVERLLDVQKVTGSSPVSPTIVRYVMTSCDSNYSARVHLRMVLAIVVIAVTLVAETIGGMMSNSLALLSDAGHVFTDLAALVLSCVAYRLTTKKADSQRSYGYHRFQVMAAFINGVSLFVIAVLIVFESIKRFLNPVSVHWKLMLVVSLGGLVANVLVFAIMYRKHEHNVNIRSAVLHVIGDLLGSVAAVLSSVVIMLSGWQVVDPLLSIVVCGIMFTSAFNVVRNSSNILLEGKPYNIDIEEIKKYLLSEIPAISDVHHVHLWSLTADYPIMTMHVRISENMPSISKAMHTVKTIKELLQGKFGIKHVTVEVECSEH